MNHQRLARWLRKIAGGDTYHEPALLEAARHPAITPEQAAAMDRYLAGKPLCMDHLLLHDAAGLISPRKKRGRPARVKDGRLITLYLPEAELAQLDGMGYPNRSRAISGLLRAAMAPDMAWHLTRRETRQYGGTETLLGVFRHPAGQSATSGDMHKWMLENGHYGPCDPEDFDWDGDADSVAVMAYRSGLPDFYFEWRAV